MEILNMGNCLNMRRVAAQFLSTRNGAREFKGNHQILYRFEMSQRLNCN